MNSRQFNKVQSTANTLRSYIISNDVKELELNVKKAELELDTAEYRLRQETKRDETLAKFPAKGKDADEVRAEISKHYDGKVTRFIEKQGEALQQASKNIDTKYKKFILIGSPQRLVAGALQKQGATAQLPITTPVDQQPSMNPSHKLT